MGLLKDFGNALGSIGGAVLGSPIKAVGEMTGIDFLKEVGDGVKAATQFTGEFLGDTVEGAATTVGGLATGNKELTKRGASQVGSAAVALGKGVGGSVVGIVKSGGQVVGGAMNGNWGEVKNGARNLARTAAVAVVAIGVVDVLDGVDAEAPTESTTSMMADNHPTPSTPGVHGVDPHWVEGHVRSDGTEVAGYWRDGDGNTQVDLSRQDGGGYLRTNPDGNPSNNLKS